MDQRLLQMAKQFERKLLEVRTHRSQQLSQAIKLKLLLLLLPNPEKSTTLEPELLELVRNYGMPCSLPNERGPFSKKCNTCKKCNKACIEMETGVFCHSKSAANATQPKHVEAACNSVFPCPK